MGTMLSDKLARITASGLPVPPLKRLTGPATLLVHYCPACEKLHGFSCDYPLTFSGLYANPSTVQWTWDSDVDEPTFAPMMVVRSETYPGGDVCAYTLTGGSITFHSASTHEMAGQTVALPDIPSEIVTSIEGGDEDF